MRRRDLGGETLRQEHVQFLRLVFDGQLPELEEVRSAGKEALVERSMRKTKELWEAVMKTQGFAKKRCSKTGFTEIDQERIAQDMKNRSQSHKSRRVGLGYVPPSDGGGFDPNMKNHYNHHGKAVETLAQRRQGPTIQLKKFHNHVKQQLLFRFCSARKNAGSSRKLELLDLACGRGGDLYKWKKSGISRVRAIDLSPDEIKEAKRRFDEIKRKDREMRMEVRFEQSDDCGQKLLPDLRNQYDAVTCMFAAHYFFRNEAMAKAFLTNVTAALKDGGYFFGTIPDGKAIQTRLAGKNIFSNSMVELEKRWEGGVKAFGNALIFKILGTVTDGGEGSKEYLVFSSVFIKLASTFGLQPITKYGGKALDSLFNPEDSNKFFKHFSPKYNSEDLEVVSRLNAAFCFQYRKNTDPRYQRRT
mmetsp:Transcript_20097/g.28295  ORF Transcript_20097/g.28295 Transcript_20097/m.28295 type:complete len:416 (-) Transcript_20097:39-1286(-)